MSALAETAGQHGPHVAAHGARADGRAHEPRELWGARGGRGALRHETRYVDSRRFVLGVGTVAAHLAAVLLLDTLAEPAARARLATSRRSKPWRALARNLDAVQALLDEGRDDEQVRDELLARGIDVPLAVIAPYGTCYRSSGAHRPTPEPVVDLRAAARDQHPVLRLLPVRDAVSSR